MSVQLCRQYQKLSASLILVKEVNFRKAVTFVNNVGKENSNNYCLLPIDSNNNNLKGKIRYLDLLISV